WEEETHFPFGVRIALSLGLAFLLRTDSGIDQQISLRVGHLPHQECEAAQVGGGRHSLKGNPRVSFGFTIEMVRRGIASRPSWIIEIPQTGQAVFAAGQTLEHVLANLLLAARRNPNPDFVHRSLQVLDRRVSGLPVVPAQIIMVTVFDGSEAA